MNFHQIANLAEAVLWGAIGAGFLWQAIRTETSRTRTRCLFAAATFLVFGLTDVIEITTGAWWRPWWLLLMKAVCVIALVALYVDHRRSARDDASGQIMPKD